MLVPYLNIPHKLLNRRYTQGRLSDKNIAVKTKAISVMSTLGKVLGAGTKKHKELMVLLVPLLADSKKTIQTQVNVFTVLSKLHANLHGERLKILR